MSEPNRDFIMDWNDTIESDGKEYVILPEGDYNFTVTELERGSYPGSTNISPCNKAILTLKVDSPDGPVSVKTDLILYRTLEWRISSFFRCIGLKKHGERLVMDWTKVVGRQGRCHIKPEEYIGRDGNPKQKNEVDRYYDYDESNFKASEVANADDDDYGSVPF